MKRGSGESGLEELMRLSLETTRQAKEIDEMQKRRAEQREMSQSVRQGLRVISISVAVGQLKQVASNELIKEVNSLINKQDNRGLRKLITDLAHDLERYTGSTSAAKIELEKIRHSAKTLAILLELYFALSD